MERQAKDGTIYQQVGQDDWTPVTRQAKNGTIYKKVGTDDWAPMTQKKTVIEEKTPLFESIVRKGIQGASSGFLDETSGVVEAAGRTLGIEGAGGSFSDMKFAKGGPTLNADELSRAYEGARQRKLDLLKKDSNDNPVSSFAAEVGGGFLNPVNKVVKGASALKQAAVIGAGYGLGNSEAKTLGGTIVDTGMGAGVGALISKAPEAVGALKSGAKKAGGAIVGGLENVGGYIVNKINPIKQRLNSQEIIEAGKKLGFKVTPAMLDDTEFISRLEYTLSESPSFFGRKIALNRDAINNKMTDVAGSATKDATKLTPDQVGAEFKSGMTAKLSEKLDPISAVFDEVASHTKNMDISQRSKDAAIKNIKNLDEYQLTGGAGAPTKFVEMIGNAKNVNQVKLIKTMLNEEIKGMPSGVEKTVLYSIRDKVSTLEKNSITRSAIQASKDAGFKSKTGEKMGREIVDDLEAARKGYKELSGEINEISLDAKIKPKGGVSNFLNEVERVPNEKIQDKFFNLENNRQLQNLQKNFPEEFDLLRKGKLKDIALETINSAQGNRSETSVAKFLTKFRDLNPEAKKILFKNEIGDIEALQTVHENLPRNFNSSNSANQAGWAESMKRNITDIPNYLLYKSGSKSLEKSIAKNAPKGVEKWTASGISNLEKHGADFSKEQLGKFANTKKGKDLLIQASDLSAGSRAMINIVNQLKNLNKEEEK